MKIGDLSVRSCHFSTGNFKAIIWAAIILCLIFAHTALSATGNIDVSTRHQTLDGFGAAVAWYEGTLVNLADNNPEIYDILFRDLGLDIIRLRNTYDYDAGYIDRSTETILEGRARTGRPLKIMLSSWSPPAYLKSNNNTIRGTLAVDANDPNYPPFYYAYDRYAQWWLDSIIDFTNHGIAPDFVDMQNEPDWVTDWDTCRFEPQENATNAGYLPAFRAFYNKLNTLPNRPIVFAPEGAGMTNSRDYLNAFDATDKSNIYAYSHHLYNYPDGGTVDDPDGYIPALIDFADDYSDKPLIQTEFSRGDSNPLTYGDAMNLAKLMHNCLYYGGETGYLYWELIWNQPKGLVSVTNTTWTINPVYYAMKHYSAFTDPNWQRIEAETNSPDLRITAFLSPDETQLSAIIINTSADTAASLDLSSTGFAISDGNVYRTTPSENCEFAGNYTGGALTLEPNSITTLALTIITTPYQSLTVSSTSGGSVITPGEGSFNYFKDSNVDLIAQTEPGYHFNDWTGSAVTAGKVADPCSASTTVFLDANYTVIANFYINPQDGNAPSPDPLVWALEPNATGATTISMEAATATDNTLPVEYYFECTTDAGKSSGWQTNTTYTAADLTPDTSYSFRVKARDNCFTPIETGWSSTISATTNHGDGDYNAPTPNPMTWTVVPAATDSNTIFMMAGPAVDDSNVEFYFDCLTEGGHDSGWQDHNTYYDTGLSSNTEYTYRVKARDKSYSHNETEWSSPFSVTTDIRILHYFSDRPADGCEPWGGLIQNGSALYGFTKKGGLGNHGTMFTVNTDGTGYVKIRNFGGSYPGYEPAGSLVQSGSYFYGMALGGGSTGSGIIFRTNLDGSGFTILYNFSAATGQYPHGSLVISGSTMYGMTVDGGSQNRGTIFKVNTDGTGFQVLHSFAGGAGDGGWPFGTLLLSGSTLYGATTYGGPSGVGTLFSIDVNGSNYRVIRTFTAGINDGGYGFDPATLGSLIMYNSRIYGMTAIGGANNIGTIFRVEPNGTNFTLLHSFSGDVNNGAFPFSQTLTPSGTGSAFYGMTVGGGANGAGTIFQIDANGTGFRVLHSFAPFGGGNFPYGYLYKSGSKLYGMTTFGAINDSGTVFEFSLPFANCAEAITDGYRLAADLNSDCYVNLKDVDILADNWLNTNCTSPGNCNHADFVPTDGTVNFSDFSKFAEQWPLCNDPQNENCPANW